MMEPPFGDGKPILSFTHLVLPIILEEIIRWIFMAAYIIIYYIKKDFDFENKVRFM